MIGFLFKKVFFDIWDNLLMLVLMSLCIVAPLGLLYLGTLFIDVNMGLFFAISAFAVFFFSCYSLYLSSITFGYSRNKKGGFKAVKDAFRFHFGHVVLHFVVLIVLVLICLYGIPFYLAFENIFGLIMGMMLFWMTVIVVLALQYYFPLCLHMEADGAFKTLKKSFILVADNLGTSFFLAFRTIIDLALTILTAFMIPGVAGISLSRMDTVKLLMLKYDFLEANPDCTKKDLNWEDLLYEERQLVGPRSFKGMIFPWKD